MQNADSDGCKDSRASDGETCTNQDDESLTLLGEFVIPQQQAQLARTGLSTQKQPTTTTLPASRQEQKKAKVGIASESGNLVGMDLTESSENLPMSSAKKSAAINARKRSSSEIRYLNVVSDFIENKMASNASHSSTSAAVSAELETFANYIKAELNSISNLETRERAKARIQQLVLEIKLEEIKKKQATATDLASNSPTGTILTCNFIQLFDCFQCNCHC